MLSELKRGVAQGLGVISTFLSTVLTPNFSTIGIMIYEIRKLNSTKIGNHVTDLYCL